jgi:hypothetical protein
MFFGTGSIVAFFAVRYSYVHDFACILNNLEYLRTPCTFINKFSQPENPPHYLKTFHSSLCYAER